MAAPKGHPRYGGKPKGYKSPVVKAREQGRQRAITMAGITAERTMVEIARVAMANRADIFKDGKLLPLEQWPPDCQALLEGVEIIIKNAEAGDGHTDTVHKVHLAKKLGALEILAKHFGLLNEKVDVNAKLEVVVRAPWRE